jgi:hypothetical protein
MGISLSHHAILRARRASKCFFQYLLARRAGVMAVLLGAILLTPLAAHAAPTSYGDIVVNPDPEPRGNASHGYTEFWITVTNRSSEHTHRITLSLPKTYYGGAGEDHLREISRTMDVGPGSTARFALLQPNGVGLLGQGIAVTIDGRTHEDPVPFTFHTSSPFYGGRRGPGSPAGPPLVLVSPGVNEAFLNQARSRLGGGGMLPGAGGAMPGGPGIWAPPPPGVPVPAPPPPAEEPDEPAGAIPPGGPGPGMMGGPGPGGAMGMGPGGFLVQPVQFLRADAPPPLWSPNWLGYSRYDGIVLTGAELLTLPGTIQTALWQYTEAGGMLLILGAGGKVPESWKRHQSESHGLTVYEPGFGVCATSAEVNFGKWPLDRWQYLGHEWTWTGTPFGTVRGVAQSHQLFPVVDDVGIPVRGLFLLMIVFALTIGPANLLILSRLKRRLWLLWTVPVISLATCAAVFGYMIVSEGWQGHLRTETLTILDETSQRASTIGFTGFYAPLTPGDGLRFSPETELTPQLQDDLTHGYARRGSGSPCTLDWSGDQHLVRGWIKPRVPAYFRARKSEARRERVTIARATDGSLTAVNGLGVDVQKLLYADAQGRIFSAGPISAGAKVALTPTGEKLEGNLTMKPAREVYATEDWLRVYSPLTANAKSFLSPHSYFAQMDDSPFLEDGLRDARTRKCRSVVIGLPREDEN